MISLIIRNVIFTILHPGLVAGLIPYLIVTKQASLDFTELWVISHYVGLGLGSIGFVIMMICICNLAIQGLGTLSPADPTKRLVISGLYRFSRNPMYLGVMLLLIGEAIFFRSLHLWIYLSFVFLAFNIFIRKREEPRLRKDFGEAYEVYTQEVGRWI